MERSCLDCGFPLKGRSDQKFCNQHCRNQHYNRGKKQADQLLNTINTILKNNRAVLKKLNPEGKIKVTRQQLSVAGFRFNYCTHFYKSQKGNTYHFCYDQGYLELERNEFLLVTEYKGLMIY